MSAVEEWRPWRTANYEVSSLGRMRRATPGRCTAPGRLLKPTLLRIGYYKVSPVVRGSNVQTYVHDAVALAFIGPKPAGKVVNHKDGTKTNNAASNLEYISHPENVRHARRTGLTPCGERHPNAKLSNTQAAEIRARRAAGEGGSHLAREYGVSPSTIYQIARGDRRRVA